MFVCMKDSRKRERGSIAAVLRVDLRNNTLGRRPSETPGVILGEKRRGDKREGEENKMRRGDQNLC